MALRPVYVWLRRVGGADGPVTARGGRNSGG
jgi:hypothetical protein